MGGAVSGDLCPELYTQPRTYMSIAPSAIGQDSNDDRQDTWFTHRSTKPVVAGFSDKHEHLYLIYGCCILVEDHA